MHDLCSLILASKHDHLSKVLTAEDVNDILGLNYHSLSVQVKLVFLDSALYYLEYGDWCGGPWWSWGSKTI